MALHYSRSARSPIRADNASILHSSVRRIESPATVAWHRPRSLRQHKAATSGAFQRPAKEKLPRPAGLGGSKRWGSAHSRPFPARGRLARPALSNKRSDLPSPHFRVLMFPDSDDQPPGRREPGIGVSIPNAVPLKLLVPVPSVHLRSSPGVIRASVPKAAVNEDCHFGGSEHDIYSSASAGHHGLVESKAKTEPVQRPAHGDFRHGVLDRLSLHPEARLWTGGE